MTIEREKQLLLKKIIYRAKYRGTKELDLLIGNFIKNSVDEFDLDELKELVELVEWSETDLYGLVINGTGSENISESVNIKIKGYVEKLQCR